MATSSLACGNGLRFALQKTAGSNAGFIPRRPKVQCSVTSQAASNDNADSKSRVAECPGSANEQPHTHSRRRLILGTMATGMIAAIGCPLCDQGVSLANAATWSYGDLSGPAEWGDACKSGNQQSPIDIPLQPASDPVLVTDNSPGTIKFEYSLASASYLNTGHGTMQVNFPKGSNACEIGGRKLELLQYHFHAPSEHSFNGVRTAMEAHLVHHDSEGNLAVIGVLLEGAPRTPRNLGLEAALSFAPGEKGSQVGAPTQCFDIPVLGDEDSEASEAVRSKTQCVKVSISPSVLLPPPDRLDGTHSYIHYKGSLTTPPCSEGVDWFVLLSPLKVPDSQVVEFMRYVGGGETIALNSRPRQDLGDRQLFLGPVVAAAPSESAVGVELETSAA